MASVLGVDFGTTNTVVSLLDPAVGSPVVVRIAGPDGLTGPFRSVLSFREAQDAAAPRRLEAGPFAVAQYLEDPADTRFIQSFKTFAASAHFQSTDVFGRRYAFEDLLSAYLLRLRVHAGAPLEAVFDTVAIGRPVRFAGAAADPALALRRYEEAFRRLGFERRRYVLEPVAAAVYFARRLSAAAVVLVADFGGGTSDFSLIRFDRRGGAMASTALASAGVGVAGDAFDYRIIDHVVSPELGKGSAYRSLDKVLPVPGRYFSAFARWSQLALLKSSRELRELKALARTALDPRLSAFVELIEDDHGYPLYRAVSELKESLSDRETSAFRFRAGAIDIRAEVARSDFEAWIAPELAQISRALEEALTEAGLTAADVDQVFLTGGSSFVPAVRRIFEDRFGAENIARGGEFDSVASGLALIGAEADLDLWSEGL